MKKTISWLVFFLWAYTVEAATIYIDGSMGADCTSGNYSIASRNCTGSAGNAYNDIQAALTASAANDTVYFRPGSITANTGGSWTLLKDGQTWAQYPGDTARSTTVTVGSGQVAVFALGGTDQTVRDLTIVGGSAFGVLCGTGSLRAKVINNDISGFNTSPASGNAGVSCQSYSAGLNTADAEVTDNYIHDPANPASDQAGVHVGGNAGHSSYISNIYIARNRIEGTRFGVWLDVQACSTQDGAPLPCIIEDHYIKNVNKHCLHTEEGSRGTWRRNICDSPGEMGFLQRPNAKHLQNDWRKFYNNSFDTPGRGGSFGIGIWIQSDRPTASVTNLEVKNNIVYRSRGVDHHALWVGELTIAETTNRYQNNLLYMVSSTNGICWGGPSNATSPGCSPTGTSYDDTTSGISSWQAAAPSGVATGNIAGDPLFANPAGEDFRLCTDSRVPHASCTGASPAINAGMNVGLSFNGAAPDLGALETTGLAAPSKVKVSQY